MSNVRIVYDNAADRATLSSTATAGNLGYTNLTSDIKSKVCRSTGTVLTVTATWPTAETVSAIVLAFTNASVTATINVKAYTNVADATAIYDVTNLCAQGSLVANKGANNLAYGGGVYASYWLPSALTVKKLVITISDASNPQGYIEAGRLIVGSAWKPSFGADQQGTSMTVVDGSQQYRTDSGDQYVAVKAKYRKQTLNMPSLDKTERPKMWSILFNNGMVKPLFISLFPENTDKELEQAHMLYGRLSVNPVMNTPYWNFMASSLDIEEV